MKVVFKIMILAAFLLGAASLVAPGVSSEEDVWCFEEDGLAFYMNTDSIRPTDSAPNGISYIVSGKTVYSNGEFGRFLTFGFAVPNDNVVGYSFGRATGEWSYIGSIKKNSNLNALWQAMKPYMKKKGIYYSDNWE